MIEIIHKLRATNSRNKKEAILKRYSSNEEWKKYLIAVYDTSINYYLKSVPDTTFYSAEEYKEKDINELLAGLNKLATRQVTGNEAKDFAISLSIEYGELFRLALGRSIKAGVTAGTINKVYDNLIPVFKVMLGKDLPVETWPVYGSIKFDGVRIVTIVKDGEAQCRTRSGKHFPLRSLELVMGMCVDGVYDGELISSTGRVKDRTTISGEANKVIKGTSTSIKDFKYMIFDRVSLEEWKAEKCNVPMYIRYDTLRDSVPESALVGVVKQTLIRSKEEVERVFSSLESEGFEGLILRPVDSLYEWKRSKYLIKKKSIKTCILKCTEVFGGKGKYQGAIGALACHGTVEGKKVRVKLGSGLSDEDRDQPPEYFAGKNVEALYNSVVKAEDKDEYSLFLGRFKRMAGDLDV